jgi:hypothetical protein
MTNRGQEFAEPVPLETYRGSVPFSRRCRCCCTSDLNAVGSSHGNRADLLTGCLTRVGQVRVTVCRNSAMTESDAGPATPSSSMAALI